MIDHRIQEEVQNGSATRKLRSFEPFALISPKHEDSLPNCVQLAIGSDAPSAVRGLLLGSSERHRRIRCSATHDHQNRATGLAMPRLRPH